jgi:hypothetical protein
MILKELINKSVYGTTGYIGSINDVNKLEQYILYNLPVLKEFKQILVVTNYPELNSNKTDNELLWKKYFPECVLLSPSINRGRNFGTADLDNMVFDYCKEHNKNWLCKSDNDVILQSELLNKEIDKADFYYINGIGFGGMVKYDFDFNRIINENFYPQTWLYFINTDKVDYINNVDYINKTYTQVQLIPNYNDKIWEHIDGWSCEYFLRECIDRNNLSKFHLITQEKYIILLEVIKNYNIHDCSYKNIMIENMCHLQFPNQKTIQI